MNILIYATIAIAFLIAALYFLRKSQRVNTDESFAEKSCAPSLGDRRWLDLSERIFDPSDSRWLADELAFPKLATALTLSRKRLAIEWLKALRASFHELACTPEPASGELPVAAPDGSLQLLWLTMRFKFLIGYALLVVKVFGPYHQLIPSFSWVPSSLAAERSLRPAALAEGRGSH